MDNSNAVNDYIERVLDREGGYVDHPHDRGGPTNYGITMNTLSSWRGQAVSTQDVKLLSKSEAAKIYRTRYWNAPGFGSLGLPDLLAEAVFDTAVNSGPARAVRMLQRCIGVTDDGIIGPVTTQAIHSAHPARLTARYLAHRGLFYGEIIGRDSSQQAFRNGWANRLAEFIERMGEVQS